MNNPKLDMLWARVPKACRYMIRGIRHVEVRVRPGTYRIIPLAEAAEDESAMALDCPFGLVTVHEARRSQDLDQPGPDRECAGCRPDRVQSGNTDNDGEQCSSGPREREPSGKEDTGPGSNPGPGQLPVQVDDAEIDRLFQLAEEKYHAQMME